MNTIAERAERGAALFDKKLPGWWREDAAPAIDLSRLDISDACDCAAGQLAGSSGVVAYVAFLHGLGVRVGSQHFYYGFEADDEGDEDAEYEALTAAWREAILSRRAAASVTT